MLIASYSSLAHCLSVRGCRYRGVVRRSHKSIGSKLVENRNTAKTLYRGVRMAAQGNKWCFLDKFAYRQFEGGHAAQLKIDRDDFIEQINTRCKQEDLVDGYAPFCKHVFVKNFAEATLNSLPITDENEHLLISGYSKRRPEELAVLTRWFPTDKIETHKAEYLDIILYSREQIIKEREELPEEDGKSAELPNVPWGVISIKPQDEDYETPMQPITIMRNSLGKDEGGSGVKIDKAAYEASVKYWQKHAPIIAGTPTGE